MVCEMCNMVLLFNTHGVILLHILCGFFTKSLHSHVADRFYKMARCSLCVNIPLFFPLLFEKVFTESLYVWDEMFQFQHGSTDDGAFVYNLILYT